MSAGGGSGRGSADSGAGPSCWALACGPPPQPVVTPAPPGTPSPGRARSDAATIAASSPSRYSSYNCLTSWDSYDKIPR